MASGFPMLFGAPGFGNEDRDQWIRVLTLFLQDPFALHAVQVGGSTQVSSAWQVPASAIADLPPSTAYNAYDIRELNQNPESRTLSPGGSLGISDRPGLFLVQVDNANMALFALVGHDRAAANLGVVIIWQDATFFGNIISYSGLTCFYNGSHWRLLNNTLDTLVVYPLIASLGPQLVGEWTYPQNDAFVGDGVTTDFTLTYQATAVSVTIDGITQPPIGAYDFYPPTQRLTIRFVSAPDLGADIQVDYQG